jgi:hypothetical protein
MAKSTVVAIAASVSATARALTSPLRIVSGVEIRCITAGRNNPEVAEAIIAQEMDIDLDIIGLAWEKHDWAARLSDEFDADIEEKKKDLKEEKVIGPGREDRTKGLVDKALGGNKPLP